MREGQLHCGEGSNPTVALEHLLVFLHSQGGSQSMWLWRELLCWAAFAIESGPLWAAASRDAADIPAPRGPKRARRLHPKMLDAVGKLAGEGHVARSGAKAVRVLRFALRRRGLWQGCSASTANDAQLTRARRYRDSAAAQMHHSKSSVLSVAMDASRMGGRDVLYSALWACGQRKGCWGDPMASRDWAKLKWPFRQKLKPLIFD